MQDTLSALTGIYSPKLVHGNKGAYRSDAAKESLGGSYDNAVDGESEVEHPLIRTHDDTGRRSIYCSLPHTHRIKGWTREESVPIFKFLMDHITQPEFVIRLKWEPGMLTIWDNRRVFHMAMNDYHGYRRHMQRVIVQGASPSKECLPYESLFPLRTAQAGYYAAKVLVKLAHSISAISSSSVKFLPVERSGGLMGSKTVSNVFRWSASAAANQTRIYLDLCPRATALLGNNLWNGGSLLASAPPDSSLPSGF